MLEFSDLTQEQIDFIANGCGAKGSWIKVPDFIFGNSCKRHDFAYWRGGNEDDRRNADEELYADMELRVQMLNSMYKRLFYRAIVYIYKRAVWIRGSKNFQYRDKMKTMADLKAEMGNGQ